MRAGPGLAPRVPARCSPAPSLADAGSEPLLHPPAARKDLPRVRPPEGGAPRVRAPAPRPGGLARCSPQRRQGASCDLRGRGAPRRRTRDSGDPGPSPSGTSGEGARAVSGSSRPSGALGTASEQEPEEAGDGGGAAARVPRGCPGPASAAPSGSFPRAVPTSADRARVSSGRPPSSSTPLSVEARRVDSCGSPKMSRPRLQVPPPSYLAAGAAGRTGLAGRLRWYPPRPQPQPGRLAGCAQRLRRLDFPWGWLASSRPISSHPTLLTPIPNPRGRTCPRGEAPAVTSDAQGLLPPESEPSLGLSSTLQDLAFPLSSVPPHFLCAQGLQFCVIPLLRPPSIQHTCVQPSSPCLSSTPAFCT